MPNLISSIVKNGIGSNSKQDTSSGSSSSHHGGDEDSRNTGRSLLGAAAATSSSVISEISELSLSHIASLSQSMQASIKIKDRKWYGKTYRNCFLHTDAVDWMKTKLTNQGKESKDDHDENAERTAVSALNDLRLAGYIQHVVDPHKCFKVGQTKKLFFCFLEDEHAHANQQTNKKSSKKNRTNKNITPMQFQNLWERSDQKYALETKLHRMESTISQLNQTQMVTQTKLEIVHQATISLIQTALVTAILLVLLIFYTLIVVAPTLHDHLLIGELSATSATYCALIVFSIAFIIKFSTLFSVFLTLDNALEDDERDDEEEEDNEGDKQESTSSELLSKNKSMSKGRSNRRLGDRRKMMKRTSTVLLEPLLRGRRSSMNMSPFVSKKVQQRQAETIPAPSTWPNRPLLVCVNTSVDSSLKVDQVYGSGSCPIGKPFWFSSDLFEGYCLIRVKGVNNSDDPDSDQAYFDGRRRLFQTIVQGRFKEEMSVNKVLTGHEFVRPLKNLPHQWILKAATNIIGKLAPGANIEISGDNPTMLASLAGTSQLVRVDNPGDEPDITSEDGIIEDCTLFGGKLSKESPLSTSARKSYFANPKKSSRHTYDTKKVYTFDFYQNLLNVNTYSLDLGIASISLSPILNGQPIQSLAKTTDGRYLWSFQIWHETLLSKSGSKKK